MVKWRGRVLMNNILAYFFYQVKDLGNALKYTFEAQQYAVELNEQRNRDCDYIISVNFVTFLILWKIGKYQEAKRYLDINRKLIDVLLNEKSKILTDANGAINGLSRYNEPNGNQSSLSVILESSHQTFNRQTLSGQLNGEGDELFNDDVQRFKSPDNKNRIKEVSMFDKKFDKKVLQQLMASDSEEEVLQANLPQSQNNQTQDQQSQHFSIRKSNIKNYSRLSQLSKLNLLGLIDLSLIAADLKISQDVDQAIKSCEDSVQILKLTNKDIGDLGIASQNLIEELRDNLLKVKEKDLDLDDINNSPSPQKTKSSLMHIQLQKYQQGDQEEIEFLKSIRKGNKIITSKEFKLVFFITCFVPFIRPNVPMIREQSMTKAKQAQKENIRKRKQQYALSKAEEDSDLYQLDMQMFEFFKRQKERLNDNASQTNEQAQQNQNQSSGVRLPLGQSLLVKLYDDEISKRQRHEQAFQNTLPSQNNKKEAFPNALNSRKNIQMKPNLYKKKAYLSQVRDVSHQQHYQGNSQDASMVASNIQNDNPQQPGQNNPIEMNNEEQSNHQSQNHQVNEDGSMIDLRVVTNTEAIANQKSKSAGHYNSSSFNERMKRTYISEFPKISNNKNASNLINHHNQQFVQKNTLSNRNQNKRGVTNQKPSYLLNNSSYYSNMFPSFVPKHKVFQGQMGIRRNIYNAAIERRENDEDSYNYEIMNKNQSQDRLQSEEDIYNKTMKDKLTSYKDNNPNIEESGGDETLYPKSLMQTQNVKQSTDSTINNNNQINSNSYHQKSEFSNNSMAEKRLEDSIVIQSMQQQNVNNSTDFGSFQKLNQKSQPKTAEEQVRNHINPISTRSKLSRGHQFSNIDHRNYQSQQQRLKTQHRVQRLDSNNIGQLLTNHYNFTDQAKQQALQKIEAQLEKNNKRFKVINNLAHEYVNQKTNNHSFLKSKDGIQSIIGTNSNINQSKKQLEQLQKNHEKWANYEGIRSIGEGSHDNSNKSNIL
ncbi:UNKNOWN [Stylonychia lemnae]|uniref:Uncharacterized protein n=1 Tax=Stylonychia lemnae TaxID=5949 RepID=A0A078ASK7_STYLE|nr:UNKNOWN [Stylonychia lemnae]|eukprot:CDW84192.1 UNKNOWN [Stylonychia lemnae]